MDILKGFNSIKDEYVNYFKPYTYDQPIIMSIEKHEELKAKYMHLSRAVGMINNNKVDHNR